MYSTRRQGDSSTVHTPRRRVTCGSETRLSGSASARSLQAASEGTELRRQRAEASRDGAWYGLSGDEGKCTSHEKI